MRADLCPPDRDPGKPPAMGVIGRSGGGLDDPVQSQPESIPPHPETSWPRPLPNR